MIIKEEFTTSKTGINQKNGDAIFHNESFIAVFDGATPKGRKEWNNQPGDVFVSTILCDEMAILDASCDVYSALDHLDKRIQKAYKENGTSIDLLPPEERLQASAIIYSRERNEIWSYGDCKFLMNGKFYSNKKKTDDLLSDLRALRYEMQKYDKVSDNADSMDEDIGRTAIMPFLKKQSLLCNIDSEFGYYALNGGTVNTNGIQIYSTKSGDCVVFSSDGYPMLFNTLKETEKYLKSLLQKDSMCLMEIRGTKGIKKGNQSFDDRTYISFSIE